MPISAHPAQSASFPQQFSQAFRREIPWEIVILALRSRPSSGAKNNGARSGRQFEYAYFQNSKLNGVIVPRFLSLFLDCFVQLTENHASDGA